MFNYNPMGMREETQVNANPLEAMKQVGGALTDIGNVFKEAQVQNNLKKEIVRKEKKDIDLKARLAAEATRKHEMDLLQKKNYLNEQSFRLKQLKSTGDFQNFKREQILSQQKYTAENHKQNRIHQALMYKESQAKTEEDRRHNLKMENLVNPLKIANKKMEMYKGRIGKKRFNEYMKLVDEGKAEYRPGSKGYDYQGKTYNAYPEGFYPVGAKSNIGIDELVKSRLKDAEKEIKSSVKSTKLKKIGTKEDKKTTKKRSVNWFNRITNTWSPKDGWQYNEDSNWNDKKWEDKRY